MSLTSTYIRGVYYKNLGEYLGEILNYPYKETFVERKHRFRTKPADGRACAEITEVLIECIPRSDV